MFDAQFTALLKDILAGQIRHYAGIAGTALASYGVLGCQNCVSETQFVTVLSGTLIASIGPALSWWKETGEAKAQARMVQMMASAEAKKTAAAKQWAEAEAAKLALSKSMGGVPVAPPATAPAPQPHEGH